MGIFKPKKEHLLSVKVTTLQKEFIEAMMIRYGVGKAELVRMSLNSTMKEIDENGIDDLLLNHRRDMTYAELKTPIKKILATHHQTNNVVEFPSSKHYVFGCGMYTEKLIELIVFSIRYLVAAISK